MALILHLTIGFDVGSDVGCDVGSVGLGVGLNVGCGPTLPQINFFFISPLEFVGTFACRIKK